MLLHKKFVKLVSPYKIGIINYYIGTLVEISVQNFMPLLEACLIDEIIYYQNMKMFSIIAMIYLLLYIGYSLNFILILCSQQDVDNTFSMDIKEKIFKKILLSKSYVLDDIKSGENLNLICKDSDEMFLIIRKNIIRCSNEIILFLTAWLIVTFMNWKMGLLMLIEVPISVFLSIYFGKIANSNAKDLKKKNDGFMSWLLEIISSVNDIHLLGAISTVTKNLQCWMREILRIKSKQNYTVVYSQALTRLVQLVGDIILYAVFFTLILRGETTIGCFVAFLSYFELGKLSIRNIFDYLVEFQYRKVSVEKIINKFDDEEEEYVKDVQEELVDYSITFANVFFGYSNDRCILKNVSFCVPEGKIVAIVGESGVGKSTIIKLLLKLYQPQQGCIKIGGVDVEQISIRKLRKEIGLVQQDINIFYGTVRYNITFGNDMYTEEEIISACKMAQIYDFISGLPSGLDTVIGGEGVELSEGQKQRLILTRIYLRKVNILVLDEATSALDYQSEHEVLEVWKELSIAGKTVIIIAHRLSTVLKCDNIIVMQDGEIVAMDNHSNLLNNCEEYRRIFNTQL